MSEALNEFSHFTPEGILEKEPDISPEDLEAKCLGYNVNLDNPDTILKKKIQFIKNNLIKIDQNFIL